MNRRNVLVGAAVALILSVGLFFTANPNVDLRSAILRLVELPKEIFHYIAADDPETAPMEPVTEVIDLAETEPTPPPTEKVETPLDLFDDDASSGSEEPSGERIDAPGVNELPMDVLE